MDIIYILDFGSQFSHLIEKRLKEMGIQAELVAHDLPLEKLKTAAGIILSGGPQNLSENTSLKVDKKIFSFGIPILGVCYGMQLMAYMLGGKVTAGKSGEYGPATLQITTNNKLFTGLGPNQNVWMSHGDSVTKLPKGFSTIGKSVDCPTAAMVDKKRKFYAIQFHAEVDHTTNGKTILKNFAEICGFTPSIAPINHIKEIIRSIKQQVGDEKALCAFSGGIDSVVAATLVNKAIGKNLMCVYVDTGFMRTGETDQINKLYIQKMKLKVKIVQAEKEFLKALQGITDPEIKRKTIGKLFVEIFEREAKKIKGVTWLVQGTLYTDAISSGKGRWKTSAVIKSHHNVGGLPEKLGFKLMEPLRDMYKFEVRQLAAQLGLPKEIVHRKPFPGPGFAVRIMGEVTKYKLDILRKAEVILKREIEKSDIDHDSLFFFPVFTGIRTVGVKGDARSYGETIGIRLLSTNDYLTGEIPDIPQKLLIKLVSRLTNEIKEVTRVVLDITPKPPGTVEWE